MAPPKTIHLSGLDAIADRITVFFDPPINCGDDRLDGIDHRRNHGFDRVPYRADNGFYPVHHGCHIRLDRISTPWKQQIEIAVITVEITDLMVFQTVVDMGS
jgi:hypothetical protein